MQLKETILIYVSLNVHSVQLPEISSAFWCFICNFILICIIFEMWL